MWRMPALGCLLILFAGRVSLCPEHPSASPSFNRENGLARLRSKVDVEPVRDLTTEAVVGHYSSPYELRQRVVPLSGNDLYLFPDGTYIYCSWSDIPPTAIQDKGTWNLSGDELTLTSDPEITWKPGVERRYLLVRRPSHGQEILAVGLDRDLRYFEEHADDDPDFMLLLVSKARIKGLSEKESMQVKKKLMREAWRPKFYRWE